MSDSVESNRKAFLRLRKRLRKAQKHAAKGKAGAADRAKGWSVDLLAHVTKHGKPSGF